MNAQVEAIYRKGVFKTLMPVKGIRNGRKVVLTVSVPSKPRPFPKLAGRMVEGAADDMIRTIEERFFSFIYTKPSTVPVRKLEDLMGGWPEEERNDGFDRAFARWRKKNVIRRLR